MLPPLYVIYDHPRDYPGHFVCRIWHGEIAEPNLYAMGTTLAEVRSFLPAGLYNLGRYGADDPAIREVWV